VFEALLGLGFLDQFLRVGCITDHGGGLPHLPHRFVEGRFEFGLESVAHLLQLRVRLGELAHGVGQFLRAEYHQGQDQDHDDLAALKIEHVGQSTGLPSSVGVQQRLPSLLDPPIAFAHRGARAHAPDNTIESFELALRLGATGLESDVWLTADGVPVLDHDGVVKQGLRKRSIADVPRAQLPPHIPSLAELFDACGTGYDLSLDLKDTRSGAAVVETVRDHDPDLLGRLWLCDTDIDRLVALRPSSDAVHLMQSTRLERIKEGPERRADLLARAGIDGINLNRRDWNGGLVVLFHRFGRYAFGWDVQYDHELRDGLRMGLDAVYSDHVDVMMDAVKAEIGST
jgi:glycerophosphoryl diester phosphodiesterase